MAQPPESPEISEDSENTKIGDDDIRQQSPDPEIMTDQAKGFDEVDVKKSDTYEGSIRSNKRTLRQEIEKRLVAVFQNNSDETRDKVNLYAARKALRLILLAIHYYFSDSRISWEGRGYAD